MKVLQRILIVLLLSVLLLAGFVYLSTFHPKDIQIEKIYSAANPPLLQKGQKIKILNWNVQYMAGKNYVFYYDLPGFDGPDERPKTDDIQRTFNKVAEIIKLENPDIVLLQEIDVGAKRTDFEDQFSRLLYMLPQDYSVYVSSYYWKALFVPHPRIMGKVGMKLATISKYKISEAKRYQLPQIPANIVTRQFNLKRCILETTFPTKNGSDFIVLNTHLDAFAQGTNTMKKQVDKVEDVLASHSQNSLAWIIGGDFNLLPPGQYDLLAPYDRQNFQKQSELQKLTDRFDVFPTVTNATGESFNKWLTQFPNDPKISSPNKTIDYFFHSQSVHVDTGYVLQQNTLDISDHLPVVFQITIP